MKELIIEHLEKKDEFIKHLYLKGYSMAEIGDELGVTRQAIHLRLKKFIPNETEIKNRNIYKHIKKLERELKLSKEMIED